MNWLKIFRRISITTLPETQLKQYEETKPLKPRSAIIPKMIKGSTRKKSDSAFPNPSSRRGLSNDTIYVSETALMINATTATARPDL
ncbi:hypothetical protein GMA8713_05194 [Grimontia marina]|uniref:Uncharacterized protein n=1 Tax=Grimontia marina TaxID=646534 RepID=A0A128FK21_9GAMM|nr:hypothetical protein GMA8713_05194 [Grimontia marina]